MPNPKKEIDMDALNAITDRVLSYTPPPKKGKEQKRTKDDIKHPSQLKGQSRPPERKRR